MLSFANNINTHEGGTHLSGFRSALTRTSTITPRKHNLLKDNEENLTGEDVREGLYRRHQRQSAGIRSSKARRRRSWATVTCGARVESVLGEARDVSRGESP